MREARIAIVGAGLGGLAAAAFLADAGHEVTLFERFESPQPLGAGLLLQPTGLAVLARLGLDRQVIDLGSRIDQLYGRAVGKRRATMDVCYRDTASNLFGVGIHRGALFSALYARAKQTSTTVQTNTEIIAAEESGFLTDKEGRRFGPFDLIVDASGSRSPLRAGHDVVSRDKPYAYGALWATVRLPESSFRVDTLEQRYQGAFHMAGVLPVGHLGGAGEHAAFFWSLPAKDHARWLQTPLDDWKQYVTRFWPDLAPLVDQLKTHEDLTLASYRDVVLKRLYSGRLVFIGDAAHCTSPQLGQGANLAMVDALVLSQCIGISDSMDEALASYQAQRRKHVWFYQTASRWLTPFFQSDSVLFAKLRFFVCDMMCHIPLARRVAADVLTGTKTGPFSRIDPGQWAADYRRLR